MSQNLSSLIKTLRLATARDSVTPERVAAIFDAVRREYEQMIADAASGGSVDLAPVYDDLSTLEDELQAYIRRNDSTISGLDDSLRRADGSLSERISVLESLLQDTPGVVNAPAILPFRMIMRSTTGASPLVQGSVAAPWYPVYYAPQKVFAARLAAYTSPLLVGNEKLYLSNVGMYNDNSQGVARTDILFSMGNNIYMHNGDALVQLTSNTVIIQ